MNNVDALADWARTYVGRLVQLYRHMTRPERTLCAALGAGIVGALVTIPLAASVSTWLVALGAVGIALLAAPVLADALVARDILQRADVLVAEAKMAALKANLAKPSGAPRVAEVRCSHGVMQRFVFGPDGWAPAGPAPDTRREEAHTP